MTGGWSLSSSSTTFLPFAAVFKVVGPFFRLLDTPLPLFLFPRVLIMVLEFLSTDSLPFFGGLFEGDGEFFSGGPSSDRGESAENKASIRDFSCLLRRKLQRTSPTGASGVSGSQAWLGLGGELNFLIRGCGSMNVDSGGFVPLGGVL